MAVEKSTGNTVCLTDDGQGNEGFWPLYIGSDSQSQGGNYYFLRYSNNPSFDGTDSGFNVKPRVTLNPVTQGPNGKSGQDLYFTYYYSNSSSSIVWSTYYSAVYVTLEEINSTTVYHPLDGRFVPIDNDTITLDNNNQLRAYVPVTDVTVGGLSVVSNGTAEVPAIPAAVSGVNDGTNWTSLTIGSDTYGIGGGGSAPSNMVTTDTSQTISGQKSFTAGFIKVDGGAGGTEGYVHLGRGSGSIYGGARITGHSGNKNTGYLQFDLKNNNTGDSMRILKFTSNDLSVDSNNATDLGTSSYKWKDLYLAGNLSDGTNTATVADIAALITYAKTQGWIS